MLTHFPAMTPARHSFQYILLFTCLAPQKLLKKSLWNLHFTNEETAPRVSEWPINLMSYNKCIPNTIPCLFTSRLLLWATMILSFHILILKCTWVAQETWFFFYVTSESFTDRTKNDMEFSRVWRSRVCLGTLLWVVWGRRRDWHLNSGSVSHLSPVIYSIMASVEWNSFSQSLPLPWYML